MTSIHTTKLAFEVLDTVGDVRGGPAPDPDSDLYEMLQSEEEFVLNQLTEVNKEDIPAITRVLLEKHLWIRWAWGSNAVATVSEKSLARCENSVVHRLQKLLLSGDAPVTGGEILREYQENEQTRLEIYISDRRDERENSEKLINELIEEFNYGDNPNLWTNFLRETSRGVSELSWKSWQFFYCLAKQFPSTSWEIFENEESTTWAGYKIQLLSGLRESDTEAWFDRLEALNASDADPSLVNWLYAMDNINTDEREKQFLVTIATNEHEPIAAAVIHYLAHSRIEDWYFRGELILNLVEKFPTEKNLDEVFSFLSHKRPDELKLDTGDLDERAIQLLLRPDLPRNVPWIDPHWVGPYFKILATIDASKFLDFLDQSTNALNESEKYAIEIRGLKNADDAIKVVLEATDKAQLINRFIQLSESPNTIPSKVGINLLFRNFELDDEALKSAFAAMITRGAHSSLARILGGFRVSEGWLSTLKTLVVSCAERGNSLDEVKSLVWPAFYIGVTTRSPGYAAPRDRLTATKMAEFLAEGDLPASVRTYFEELKEHAKGSIQDDKNGDERLIGRKLSRDEREAQED